MLSTVFHTLQTLHQLLILLLHCALLRIKHQEHFLGLGLHENASVRRSIIHRLVAVVGGGGGGPHSCGGGCCLILGLVKQILGLLLLVAVDELLLLLRRV